MVIIIFSVFVFGSGWLCLIVLNNRILDLLKVVVILILFLFRFRMIFLVIVVSGSIIKDNIVSNCISFYLL